MASCPILAPILLGRRLPPDAAQDGSGAIDLLELRLLLSYLGMHANAYQLLAELDANGSGTVRHSDATSGALLITMAITECPLNWRRCSLVRTAAGHHSRRRRPQAIPALAQDGLHSPIVATLR